MSGKDRLQTLQLLYEARATMTCLDHVPDRARAETQAAELGRVLSTQRLLGDPTDRKAEAALPLDFAPTPQSLANRWFDDTATNTQLDHLCTGQSADGGYEVPWALWTPITRFEWRGIQTLEHLEVLRAYGRL